MTFLLHWLILSVAVWIAATVVPGFRLKHPVSALVVAALFGVLNFFLGWLIFVVIGVATAGLGFLLAFLTRWVVNAILLKVTDAVLETLSIDGFVPALLAALVMSGVGTVGEWVLGVV